jgi:hypothetical protein
VPDFGIKKKAYRPRWQDTPGYQTVVDQDSQSGVFPAQTESDSIDRGQSNLDSMWPVQPGQGREKERALPLTTSTRRTRSTISSPRREAFSRTSIRRIRAT